ncbi:radical SAM protein, partial [Desulfovibrio sp. 1214_IL3152]
SRPQAVARLAEAGLTSMRVSLNSARPVLYERYYRPVDYCLDDVKESIRAARSRGVFVALNLLFFPGITDTEEELDALARMVGENGVSMIQWRNLNIDPEWYFKLMNEGQDSDGGKRLEFSPSMGLTQFMKRLKKLCPWLRYGYFNPYVGDRAELEAPAPGDWSMPAPRAKEGALAPGESADGSADGATDAFSGDENF